VGDVPALLLVAAVLWLLSPKGERFIIPKTTLATQALALSRRRRGPAYVRFQ